ncbi:hypothetical protein UlMin_028967 [Ulmus minor]
MVDLGAPLDFESEDLLLDPPPSTKKRKKIIGLDDLLADFYKEKSRNVEKEAKLVKKPKKYNSDDEENTKEACLSKLVNECVVQIKEIGGEEDIPAWGVPLFGEQKTPPPLISPELERCNLLKSFMNNELNSLVDLSSENGGTFLEGLLVSGWLSRLVLKCGHAEESIASWTLYLMLYSSKEELRTSACDFWGAILPSKEEISKKSSTRIEWFPSYSELRNALEVYGFHSLPNEGADNANSGCGGPAQNIRCWIKFVTAVCQMRSKWSMFSTSEAEELVEVIISLFLDRLLQGLSLLLYDCMESVISYFTDEEWKTSCDKIAKSLAGRVPIDFNCIRMVECISGVGIRSKLLRSAVAHQILLSCLDHKAADEEILRALISINLKEKSCDLFMMYIYLVMAENWLLSIPLLEDKPVLKEMWGLYLRNCSCLISSTDLRSFASKVRNKASFLLQGATKI